MLPPIPPISMLLFTAHPVAFQPRAKESSGSHDNIEIGGAGVSRAWFPERNEDGDAMHLFFVDGRFLELINTISPTLRLTMF